VWWRMSAMPHKTSWAVAGHLTQISSVLLSALIFAGCRTLPNDRRWGQDAFSTIDLDRISRAAHNALFDLNTLVPLTGALVFAVDDFDEKVSDWAVKHTPIFGSAGDARDASS